MDDIFLLIAGNGSKLLFLYACRLTFYLYAVKIYVCYKIKADIYVKIFHSRRNPPADIVHDFV